MTPDPTDEPDTADGVSVDGEQISDVVDKAATRASDGRDTFHPPTVDNRFRRTVRDDHAPNAALHSAIEAAAEYDDRIASVNLMGSHAPGEKDHAPSHYVSVTFANGGGGDASTGPTFVGDLMERGKVRCLKAFGGATYRDVDVEPGLISEEVARSTITQATDELTVHLRPVETRVEPVEVPVRDVPDDVVGVSEDTVAAFLGDVDARLHEELRSVSPLRVFRDVAEDYGDALPDPDRDGADTRLQPLGERLSDFPDGWRDKEVAPSVPVDMVEAFEDLAARYDKLASNGITDETSPEDVAERAASDIRVALDDNVGDSGSPDRPPVGPIEEWVEDNQHAFLSDKGDAREVAEEIADTIVERSAEDTTRIPCGCGDYHVDVPAGTQPEAIDVVCPECGNHFGHATDDEMTDQPLEADAATVLNKAATDPSVHDSAIRPVARALATIVSSRNTARRHNTAGPEGYDDTPSNAHDKLWERADVDREAHSPDYYVTEVDGEAWAHDAIEDGAHALGIADAIVNEHAPTPYRLVFDGPTDDRVDDAAAALDLATTDVIQFWRDDYDPTFVPLPTATDSATPPSGNFVSYSRRRAGKCGIHVVVQDKDTGEIVDRLDGKAGGWNEVDTGNGLWNVRVDVGASTPAAKPVTAYVCHSCERKTLPEDFFVPSCSCAQHEDAACDECGGRTGPRCPRCGTDVDWDESPGADE